MAEGRQRLAWDHTSTLCAMVKGIFEECTPAEFHPFVLRERQAQEEADEDVSGNWAALEKLVVDGRFA